MDEAGAGREALTREDTGRLTRDQMMKKILREVFRMERGQPQNKRVVQITVHAREISLAHVIGVSEEEVYRTLGLTIGFHKGADLRGQSLGLLHMTPPECVVIAADAAVKAGEVDIRFMDRFKGTLILTGARAEVDSAMRDITGYFRDGMGYTVCPLTHQ